KGLLESRRFDAMRESDAACEELASCDEEALKASKLLEEASLKNEEARKRLSDLERDIAEARVAVDAARRSVHERQARIAALEAIDRAAREKNAAAAWMAAHAKDIDGTAVPIASLIKAPIELEALVERLLGADAQAWLASDAEHAFAIASSLHASAPAGTASVLFADDGRIARRHTGVRRLIDALDYPDDLASAMEALLGDVAVVDSFDEALDRANDGAAHMRYVTLDGMTVHPGAKVSFSRTAEAQDGVLARERELDALRAELAVEAAAASSAEERLARLDDVFEGARAASIDAARAYAERKGEHAGIRSRRDRICARIEALEGVIEAACADAEETQRTLDAAHRRAEELARAIEDARRCRDDADERVAQALLDVQAVRDEEQGIESRLSESKLRHATASERIRSLEREYRERCADKDCADRRIRRAAAEKAAFEAALKRIDPLREALASLKKSANGRIDELEARRARAQADAAENASRIEHARAASAQAQSLLDEARAASGEARIEKGRIEVRVESAIDSIVKGLGVSLETALEQPLLENRQAAEDDAAGLRRRLRAIGACDPSAVDEYAAMKERYDFLMAQIEDVEAARAALRRIVSAIDERMKECFDAAFERVDGNFRSIFAQLFPGGSGWLSLERIDDEGTLGVEVHAQPRGKRIAKMTLMSGGEKSLVAIALLFAVYGIRRTPFYILDEVEAALDDSNLRRLLAYLETLRHETQLIMITHQRRTMEMADVLYGVSMQADGVTKAVSQKLERASEAG
ncbi:MAG: chromosome segregation protein SMC, partial [Slackia sp.]|nr:chromosome segregation protein SMC [Slackia sp.]